MKPAIEKKRNCNNTRPNNGPAAAAAARAIAAAACRRALKPAFVVNQGGVPQLF